MTSQALPFDIFADLTCRFNFGGDAWTFTLDFVDMLLQIQTWNLCFGFHVCRCRRVGTDSDLRLGNLTSLLACFVDNFNSCQDVLLTADGIQILQFSLYQTVLCQTPATMLQFTRLKGVSANHVSAYIACV